MYFQHHLPWAFLFFVCFLFVCSIV
jgi:hypothetical protein